MRTAMMCVIGLFLSSKTVWIDSGTGRESAAADLLDGRGETIGHATFSQLHEGVRIRVVISDLPPGIHAMLIHGVAKGHGTDFASGGAHFNPFGKRHGVRSFNGPHAGDLPNLTVREDGTAEVEVTSLLLALKPGRNSLLPSGKTCLVIHEQADDEVTDPTGNSGVPIAGGLIVNR